MKPAVFRIILQGIDFLSKEKPGQDDGKGKLKI
jgi:hypothetical protein